MAMCAAIAPGSRPAPCRKCGGKKTVEIEAGGGRKRRVACPVCRGTGMTGMLTKWQ